MPYASDAQRRFFHTDTARKKGISAETVKEFDEASRGKKLPEHAKKAYWEGVKAASAFAAPPKLPGSGPKTTGLPAAPKPPSAPKPPEPLAHQVNDINSSMASANTKLTERQVQPE